MEPNGEFPTLKSPNPEEAGAFELAMKQGKETAADILITADPDGDRVGVAVQQGDRLRSINWQSNGRHFN